MVIKKIFPVLVFFLWINASGWGQDQVDFRIYPYLQNPTPDGMTVIWFTNTGESGRLIFGKMGSDEYKTIHSLPEPAPALAYSAWENTMFFEGEALPSPYRHRVRMEGLEPATTYFYDLVQGMSRSGGEFRTAPAGDTTIRFVVYSDSETEPESTGAYVGWVDTAGVGRTYMVDQSAGYRNNLAVIRSRKPDLVLIAGDLVQHGGEQRDWDEFWRHNAGSGLMPGLASGIPIMPALGNHEYYEGQASGLYYQPDSEQAVDKYQAYFELPANLSPNSDQEGRYYSCKYGPANFIVLDVCNNGLNTSEDDTNFYLLGESDSAGGNAPDFGPGSRQYIWLEEQLVAAQKDLFTFVLFHHAPYSSGPHSFPPGIESQQDNQSGVPVRQLTPLFLKYGVDAVFSGHDEMWERSEVTGSEVLPDGSSLQYTLHFYDVGIGGDGLRAPWDGSDNPSQAFLAHKDSPEVWADSVLLEGGKHYGHLEVNISPVGEGRWQALLDPVYVLPVRDSGDSQYNSYSRKLYKDRVTLIRKADSANVSTGISSFGLSRSSETFIVNAYPNPFHERVTIPFNLSEAGALTFTVSDLTGRMVYAEGALYYPAGNHELSWEGRGPGGHHVPPGIYLGRIETSMGLGSTIRLIRY